MAPGAPRTATRSGRPLALHLWRDLLEGRPVADAVAPDPDGTAAALVRRWAQHFAVAIDGTMERSLSGSERLPEIVSAWLDLARRTAPVRAHIAAVGGPLTAAEQARQEAVLVALLREDLALIGAAAPDPAARGLLRQLALVAAAEDVAGTRLPAHRTAALRAAGLPAAAPSGVLPRCRLLRRRRGAVAV